MNTKKKTTHKKVKAWAVCFALNEQCLQGDIVIFSKQKNAKEYIVDLHKKIGGFEDDHHLVPITITYEVLPTKVTKRNKPSPT